MKKFLALLLAAMMMTASLTACGSTEENTTEETTTETTTEETQEEVEEEQEEEVELVPENYTYEDMVDIDIYDDVIDMYSIDYSKQPHFTNDLGLDSYFRNCVANRCRQIAFTADKGVKVEVSGGGFCEDYLLVWCNYKMEPGKEAHSYLASVTYYPGDNVAWAYLNNDTSGLTAKEQELYDVTVAWLEENITDEMTDVEKATLFHNYLAGNAVYSNDLFANLNTSFTFDYGITAYGAMVDHMTICQGYADAFRMLCTMEGIECTQIYGTGNGGPHNWNMIKLNDNWYHVDCTFDNRFDANGLCSKGYLFVSDAQIGKSHTWERDRYPEATDDSLWYYNAHDLVLDSEEELDALIGTPASEGKEVNVRVDGVDKKVVLDYINNLGLNAFITDHVKDFIICIPAA